MTDRQPTHLSPLFASRPVRVLIAGDDPAAANVLGALLGSTGYEITATEDGALLPLILDEGPPPDVVILDWMLPENPGLEICRRVRARWSPLALPILTTTNGTDAGSIAAAFDAGANDCLPRPFLAHEVRARVAAHARVKRQREEMLRLDAQLMEREKLATLGLLVSSVAHDLNNPLGGIAGCAQLLLADESAPERREALRTMLGEVKRCNRIVGDLLSFSRRRPVARTELDLAEVLRNTLALRERQIHCAGVRNQVEIDPRLPRLRGDPHQLQQVFLNLLINAEQALRQGGETLHVRARLAPPASGRAPGREWVVVTFFNDGPTIPPETLPRIFEPFYTTKREGEGTGLGLSICRRIVREHGGDIDVESGPDGTTFRIRLPAAAGN